MSTSDFGLDQPPTLRDATAHHCARLYEEITFSVHGDLSDIAEQWRAFEEHALGTVFQTYEWLSAWLDTVGRYENIEPVIVTGRNADQALAFILPLQISRHGITRVLGWLGGEHSNYQMGLLEREWLAGLTDDRFRAIWQAILACLPTVDAVHFINQPLEWEGLRNPFARLPSYPSANSSFLLNLSSDFDTLYGAKRSGSTRRSARKRDRRLAEAGTVDFREVGSEGELDQVLSAMFEQKVARMAEIGVGDVYGPHFRAFLTRLGRNSFDRAAPLRCHYLTCGTEIAAIVVGAVSRKRYYGLVLSMTEGPLKRHSPGDLALRRTIEECCHVGIQQFDLSQGHASYKMAWADQTIGQFDTIAALTTLGQIYAVRERLMLSMKRTIKESPTLWPLAQAMRRGLHGKSTPTPSNL